MVSRKLFILAFIGFFALAAKAGDNVVVTNLTNQPVPVKVIGSISATSTVGGATHEANSQVTASGTAGTLAIARPTRVGLLIKNTDSSITVYIGAATVSSANGMPLKAGESVVVTAQILWQVIAASGSPVVAIVDEYN